LTCVLGPSGSGKSTLMNVLAGRQNTEANGASSSGEVLVNGRPIRPSDFRSNVAYVMQDDSLLATETPRECLDFSAYLRLPQTVTAEERSTFVERLLGSLHLTKCANTNVGSALVKGISGGERKRTSVGVELITNPSLLFLDEPLSGLDSYAAYTLTQSLKDLAQSGVPVLCTVHQPSSEIFNMMDDVIILHDGDVTYHGPAAKLSAYFDQLGFPCPANFNPADHVMFMLQKEPAEKIKQVKDAWLQSDLYQELMGKLGDVRLSGAGGSTSMNPSRQGTANQRVGFCKQLVILFKRELRGTLRNKGVMAARYGMAIFLSGLYAWLFAGAANTGDGSDGPCLTPTFNAGNCAADFQAHFGTIVSLAISAMMGAAQPILLTFPNERPVFLREYAAQQYGVVAYFISKTLVELPVVLGTQVVTFLLAYWIMGLHGNFVYLTVLSWLLGIASSSLSLIVGCGVASAQKAIQLAPLVLIPQMLFSGLFIPVSKIPSSLRWVRYLCPLKYAINLLELEEFRYVEDAVNNCEAQYGELACMTKIPGDYIRISLLENQSIEYDQEMFYLGALVALLVGFRVIATVLLWRKGKYVF